MSVCIKSLPRAAAVPAACPHLSADTVELVFDEPVRALALGQVCAFYAPQQQLLGGGFFRQIG